MQQVGLELARVQRGFDGCQSLLLVDRQLRRLGAFAGGCLQQVRLNGYFLEDAQPLLHQGLGEGRRQVRATTGFADLERIAYIQQQAQQAVVLGMTALQLLQGTAFTHRANQGGLTSGAFTLECGRQKRCKCFA